MIRQHAVFATADAGRYILKLCKHFRHKVPAEFTEQQAKVDFKPGLCWMLAQPDGLLLQIEDADAAALGRLHYILEDHIGRLARVKDFHLEWHSGQAAPLATAA